MLKNNKSIIGGKNSVLETISKKPDTIKHIICSASRENEIKSFLDKRNLNNLKVLVWNKNKIDKLFNNNLNHQDIACEIKDNVVKKNINLVNTVNEIIIFEELYDLRNVGSIIRTGLAYGVKHYFLNKRNVKGNFDKIYKSSSGYSAHVNIFEYTNISNLIKNLKKQDFWFVALDNSSENISIDRFDWPRKTAIILGNENYGIKKLTKSNCDYFVKIPIANEVESLNVSNAFSILISKKKAPSIK
jgi:23S rRNA (guanosine2251-2'-O)-methyltransferase